MDGILASCVVDTTECNDTLSVDLGPVLLLVLAVGVVVALLVWRARRR